LASYTEEKHPVVNAKKNSKIDLDDLRVHHHKCFATFAGDKGELIVLLSRDCNDDIL
jgi:hypothetical protein